MLLEKMHKIMRKTEIKVNLIKKNSLNLSYRQKNYEKINHDNRSLFARLKKKQPNYNIKHWANERKVIENRILMISRFQDPLKQAPKTQKSPKKFQTFDLRFLVFKKGLYLKNTAFLLEIYQYPHDLRILAIDGVTSDIYRLILSPSEVFAVLRNTQNWNFLTSCLKLEENSLILSFPS